MYGVQILIHQIWTLFCLFGQKINTENLASFTIWTEMFKMKSLAVYSHPIISIETVMHCVTDPSICPYHYIIWVRWPVKNI
jgi:hypothetical protein